MFTYMLKKIWKVSNNYFPIQNFEKILSKTASLSVLPTISPNAFRASRISDAVSSAATSAFAFFTTDLQNSNALCNDCACRAETNISSAEAVIWKVFMSLDIELLRISVPLCVAHEIFTQVYLLNFEVLFHQQALPVG